MKKVKARIWYPSWSREEDTIEVDVPDDVETEYINEYLNENAEEIIKRECVGEVMLLDEALDGDYAGIEQIEEKPEVKRYWEKKNV